MSGLEQIGILNATASRAAKEAGQQLALSFAADWRDDVMGELRTWLQRQRADGAEEMVFEQFRAVARCQPASHKAWGALPRLAMAEGLIKPLMRADGSPVMRVAESVKTHGHLIRVWKIA